MQASLWVPFLWENERNATPLAESEGNANSTPNPNPIHSSQNKAEGNPRKATIAAHDKPLQ